MRGYGSELEVECWTAAEDAFEAKMLQKLAILMSTPLALNRNLFLQKTNKNSNLFLSVDPPCRQSHIFDDLITSGQVDELQATAE